MSSTVRTQRREPCPCGSGKKFKNCHEGQPGYEVAAPAVVAAAADASDTDPTDALAALPSAPKRVNQKHFPGQHARTIASQPGHRAFFRNPGG